MYFRDSYQISEPYLCQHHTRIPCRRRFTGDPVIMGYNSIFKRDATVVYVSALIVNGISQMMIRHSFDDYAINSLMSIRNRFSLTNRYLGEPGRDLSIQLARAENSFRKTRRRRADMRAERTLEGHGAREKSTYFNHIHIITCNISLCSRKKQ